MIYLLELYLSVFSFSWLIVYSKILENPVDYLMNKSLFLEDLLSCIICTSFWVALFFATLNYTNFNAFLFNVFSSLGFVILVTNLFEIDN